MRAEAEVSFEDVVLRIPSDEVKPGFGLHQHLPLSLISGRATWRDAGGGDVEMVDVRIDPPIHGQAPWTLHRPHNVRSPLASAAPAGALFRWIEASIMESDREQIIDALDDAGNADMQAADAAWGARV